MVYSFLFSYNQNINYNEVYETFKNNYYFEKNDFELIFMISEKEEKQFSDLCEDKIINASVFVFDEKSNENERIETTIKKIQGNNFILTRSSCSNFNFEKYIEMITLHNSENHIVVSRRKNQNNLYYYYTNIAKKLVTKFLYGFESYEGEADIILVDSVAVEIIKSSPGRSTLMTKFNNWKGLNVDYVEIGKQKKVKTNRKPLKSDLMGTIISSLFFIGLLTTEIVVAVLGLANILVNFLISTTAIASLLIVLYFLLRMKSYIKNGHITGVGSARIKKEL